MFMKTNLGEFDRIMRFALGVMFLGTGLFLLGGLTTTAGIISTALGVIMLGTSAVGFCPLYLPFGISTCRTKNN